MTLGGRLPNDRQHEAMSLWSTLRAAWRRVRPPSLEGLTHLSVTYPYTIRRDKIARVMTQLHYRLRTGSTSSVWRTDDGVGFESMGQFEISQNDVMSGVVRGTIVATPLHAGDDFEVGADLTLAWTDVLVPGAGAIFFWLVLRFLDSSQLTLGAYLAIVIGPIVIHALMRLQVKRAWQDWLDEGIDESNESARRRYNARRERR